MDEILYDKVQPAKLRGWEGFSHVSTLAANLLTGLGDWIGIGNTIRNWLSTTPNYKNLQDIKSRIVTRINQLLASNSIDVDKLEKRLNDLQASGFNLSGIALKRLHDEVESAKSSYNQAKQTAMTNELKLQQAQADVDALDAGPSDIAEIYEQQVAANNIYNQLGGPSND